MKKIIQTCIILVIIMSFFGHIGASINNNNNLILGDRETLEYFPQSHNFGNMYEGEVADTIFEIWRGGGCCELTYSLSWSETWIDVFPTSGVSNGEHDPITVTVDTTGLALGLYNADILIQSSAGNANFHVILNVIQHGDPTLAYYPQSHHFGYLPEGSIESTEFEVWNTGVGTLTYSLSWDETWVDVSPTSGSSTGEHDIITVTIDTTGFEPGSSHTCPIQIDSDGGDKIFTVLVNIGESEEISIGEIAGGLFRINAKIHNTGTSDIMGIDWKISLDGGLIVLGKEKTGKIIYLPAGEETTLTSDLILGLGSTTVTVDIDTSEIISQSKTVDAKLLLVYVSI